MLYGASDGLTLAHVPLRQRDSLDAQTVAAPTLSTVGGFYMLFEGELGVNRSAGSYKSYRFKCSFGREYFRTRVTAEIIPAIQSRLFPLPLGRGLLFIFRRKLSPILEVRVLFIFRF